MADNILTRNSGGTTLAQPIDPLTARTQNEVRVGEQRAAAQPPPAPLAPQQPESSTVAAPETRYESRLREAKRDGHVDAGEMMTVIEDALDPDGLLADLMNGSEEFFKALSNSPGTMEKLKEVLRRVNAAKDAYGGMLDSLGDRRKKLAEGLGRV